jgi:hypothetical protein
LKNLSSICSKKLNGEYSRALELLIKAAKIDDTDRCLWYDIGENALKLNKFMIARYAFEKCLSIDANDWYSLDNLIVILYALGNYSLCLSHTLNALNLDKFYINGLIIMIKIKLLNDSDLNKEIDSFRDRNYESQGIELDAYLAQLEEELYDNLMHRIEIIKTNHKNQLNKISENVKYEINNNQNENFYEVKVQNNIRSWQMLGKLILDLSQKSEIVS